MRMRKKIEISRRNEKSYAVVLSDMQCVMILDDVLLICSSLVLIKKCDVFDVSHSWFSLFFPSLSFYENPNFLATTR